MLSALFVIYGVVHIGLLASTVALLVLSFVLATAGADVNTC